MSAPCPAGWAATERSPSCNYTGGHYCVRDEGHDPSAHRCTCGATTTRRAALDAGTDPNPPEVCFGCGGTGFFQGHHDGDPEDRPTIPCPDCAGTDPNPEPTP